MPGSYCAAFSGRARRQQKNKACFLARLIAPKCAPAGVRICKNAAFGFTEKIFQPLVMPLLNFCIFRNHPVASGARRDYWGCRGDSILGRPGNPLALGASGRVRIDCGRALSSHLIFKLAQWGMLVMALATSVRAQGGLLSDAGDGGYGQRNNRKIPSTSRMVISNTGLFHPFSSPVFSTTQNYP